MGIKSILDSTFDKRSIKNALRKQFLLDGFKCSEVKLELSAAIVVQRGVVYSIFSSVVVIELEVFISSVSSQDSSKASLRRTALSQKSAIVLEVDTRCGQRRTTCNGTGGQLSIGIFGSGSDLGENLEEHVEVEKRGFEVGDEILDSNVTVELIKEPREDFY